MVLHYSAYIAFEFVTKYPIP